MKPKNHQAKPLTTNVTVFFKRLFPVNLFTRLNKDFDLDRNRKKIKFRTFCLFIILVVIIQPQWTSTRDIENASKRKSLQLLSGQESISHTAIAERLKSIPSECIETLLNHLTHKYKKKLKHKSRFLKGMKVFDVTTFSVSAKHYAWAAKRQSRANIRFLFVMDSRSGTPDAVINSSKNLNDNKIFNEAITSSKTANVFVFDKGFNSFAIFKKIVKLKKHFITRFKENYLFEPILNREINSKEKLERNWFIESDVVGVIGKTSHENEIIVRKIACRNSRDNKTFTVMTDERNWAANKIVQMYVYRWPIEVFFRHIKSNLQVTKFPSHDRQGVKNWMMLIALSILIMQFLTFDNNSESKNNLMDKKTPFKTMIRESILIIETWIIIEVKNKIE